MVTKVRYPGKVPDAATFFTIELVNKRSTCIFMTLFVGLEAPQCYSYSFLSFFKTTLALGKNSLSWIRLDFIKIHEINSDFSLSNINKPK